MRRLLILILLVFCPRQSSAIVRIFRLLPNNPTVLQEKCYSKGGNLAVVINKETQAQALHAATTQSPTSYLRVRIGAQIFNPEEGFSWEDGSGFVYNNWEPGQPDNYKKRGEKCVEMRLDPGPLRGKWNDQLCDIIPMALCESVIAEKYRVMENHMNSIGPLCYANGGRLAIIQSILDQKKALKVFRQAGHQGFSGDTVRLGVMKHPEFNVVGRRSNKFIMPREESISYTNWAYGEPNNDKRNEDCLELQLDQGARWNDVPCAEPYMAICQFITSYNTTYRVIRNKPDKLHRWCFSKGGSLATIRNEEEQEEVTIAVRNNYERSMAHLRKTKPNLVNSREFINNFQINFQRVLLGARKMESFTCPEHLFSWVVGYSEMNFTNWLPGQPSNQPGENCVEMTRAGSGGWNDVECFKTKLALCEYKEMPAPAKRYEVIEEEGIDEARHYDFWEEQCRHRRGMLAKINSEEEQRWAGKAVRRLRLGKIAILIGATMTRYYPRYFAWLDGSRLEFTYWVNETRSEDDDCITVISSGRHLGRWRAAGCQATRALCQFTNE